jgi:hypothetical protein
MNFGEELDTYVVLKLTLKESRVPKYEVDSNFKLYGVKARSNLRKDEQVLLKRYFRNWKAPYYNQLSGWEKESPLYIVYNEKLVSGLYVCSENEFNEKGWGQLHYFFTHPEFKGKKLHSILVREAIKKAELWELEGVIINTDRHQLPDIYLKWGATYWKEIEKSNSSMPLSLTEKVLKFFSKG